ncbi:hypothetical protein [Hazenella coriacea]|uniref:Uncharacterized protein n=1 Tax=Hazenella coriacea TaxID=1179467 RepID=A0A4R3LBL7_9BACL|nr:hypothetical protein [Hazenella coriacea]TCS96620.1 hypothetical protein EDD58_101256 [Hazenella coriacea]
MQVVVEERVAVPHFDEAKDVSMMRPSSTISEIAAKCQSLFKTLSSDWQSIEPQWRDSQRKKFEQSEIAPVLSSEGQLLSRINQVYSIICEIEKRGYLP